MKKFEKLGSPSLSPPVTIFWLSDFTKTNSDRCERGSGGFSGGVQWGAFPPKVF